MGVPYCIVKGKARLGTVVHKKTATALCINDVRAEDKKELADLVSAVKANYNDKDAEIRRSWGGGVMGQKSGLLERAGLLRFLAILLTVV
jgi:large subunit ribosomal protein L7Ae